MARPKVESENITSQRIAALAKEQRLSQRLLAEKMKVAPVTIHRWMSGKSYISNDYLSELAEVLGTTSDYLRGHTDAKTQEEQAVADREEAERWGVDDGDIPCYDASADNNRDKQRRTVRSRFFSDELGFTYEEERGAAFEFSERPYILKDRNGVEYRFNPEEFSMLMYQISTDIIAFACNRKKGGNMEVR